jgi:uncharacterized membrane protein YphA (DoxX/SURF4 family)
VIVTLCTAVLGGVFLVAAATKVAAGARWKRQAAELGAPASLAVVLPWVELVLGALLVTQVAIRWAAAAALLLLVAFSAFLVVRLRQGRRPPCACFGGWSSRPLGWGHVARNGALAVLAAVATVSG